MFLDENVAYSYGSSGLGHHHAYLLPKVIDVLGRIPEKRIFDLGCGNGSTAHVLSEQGFNVTGVDPSESGIAIANRTHPDLRLHVGSAYDDLAGQFGTFPAVISLEVIEHVFRPREFANTLFSLVEPGGIAVVSTPYHGYLKNVVLAASGKLDEHFTALWDYGHIKFWSIKTLGQLLQEAGFSSVEFLRVGRWKPLAKSMIAVATRR